MISGQARRLSSMTTRKRGPINSSRPSNRLAITPVKHEKRRRSRVADRGDDVRRMRPHRRAATRRVRRAWRRRASTSPRKSPPCLTIRRRPVSKIWWRRLRKLAMRFRGEPQEIAEAAEAREIRRRLIVRGGFRDSSVHSGDAGARAAHPVRADAAGSVLRRDEDSSRMPGRR